VPAHPDAAGGRVPVAGCRRGNALMQPNTANETPSPAGPDRPICPVHRGPRPGAHRRERGTFSV